MTAKLFERIDDFFIPWAQTHGLQIYTQVKDEETRAVLPVDELGNEFEIWAVPEFRPGSSEVSVGAALLKLGGRKRTFFRTRKHYQFVVSVHGSEVGAALSAAWARVQEWKKELIEAKNA